MKIAIATVSRQGYSHVGGNRDRLDLLARAVEALDGQGVDLLCIPAGFFMAESMKNLQEIAGAISELVGGSLNLVLGFDLIEKDHSLGWLMEIEGYSLPWFVMGFHSDGTCTPPWRQRSMTSENQAKAHDVICKEKRSMALGDKQIEVLACGEIFNERIRSSVLSRGVDVVVDLAHTMGGYRVWGPLRKLAGAGLHSFCCGHADVVEVKKWYFAPSESGWVDRSTKYTDIHVKAGGLDGLRMEVKSWDI